MKQSFDVLIVGGGIVGLTAALAMAERQYHVALIDAGHLDADPHAQDLRVYAINQASQNLLTQLDVWQLIDKQRISPYQHMHVWDAANGAFIDFDSRSIAASSLGSIMEESVLKHALLQRVKDHSHIHLFPHSTVEEVSVQPHSVSIGDLKQQWEGQLLMIADGAQSPTRQKLNVELTTWSYQHHALVATVTTEKPHLRTAYQVFNHNGPLAFLPLVHPNQCSIVWSTEPTHAQQLMALDDNEFNGELTKAFHQKLGQVEVASTRHQFPLHMRHVKRYSGQRWLLLGDAAHTIHPLAGLGLNVGLADVASWMRCIDRNQGLFYSNKNLGAYHRKRHYEVWQIIIQMEGFKQLFSPKLSSISPLRGLGLRLCNQLTPLKRLFIQHATGIKS